MSTSIHTPKPAKSPAENQRSRSPGGSQAQSGENLEVDNDSLQSVAGGLPDDSGDESGSRALHEVASAPNPNVGRDDVERPPREPDGRGSVEST
jgi:hypothetical protein